MHTHDVLLDLKVGNYWKTRKAENADHQAALASSVGAGMLSFAHRPAVYHFSAWTVNTTACLYMNFELALTQMTCIICDDCGEPGLFKLRLQDAPGADAFDLTLSSCTFSQLLMAALKDSLFKLRFRRCILRCLWAVAKGVNQKSCRLYSISADISMALYIPYQRNSTHGRCPKSAVWILLQKLQCQLPPHKQWPT